VHFEKNFGKAVEHYFLNGRVSATNIRELVSSRLRRQPAPLEFLDFASGYGCVARHIRNVFPGVNVTAMDIHEKAFWFNQTNLKVKAALSSTDPADASAPAQFDVVFALSFFSHMPRKTQLPWLARLSEFVKPGGIFIFTTHGETSHKNHMPHIAVGYDGYGFISESEQFDLSTDNYGHAVTYKSFMLPLIEKLDSMSLVELREGFWWTHQDTYVLTKVV
jgi:SAM-dependent methyltransferase